jgi:hypothetical protein
MACTRLTAICNGKEYKKHKGLPPCCKSHLAEILSFTTNLFDQNNIKYWLDYGTLLGQYRDGGLIERDTDVDLSITVDGLEKLESISKIFNDEGFCFVKRNKDHWYKVRYSKFNTIHADIFIWHRKDGMMFREHYIHSDMKKGRNFPEIWIENLVELNNFKVPANTHEFLAFRYGFDFMTPKLKKL